MGNRKSKNDALDVANNNSARSVKLRLFAEKWVQYRCGKRAAIAAGYKDGPGINVTATKLLKNPKVVTMINNRLNEVLAQESIKAEDVTRRLLQIAFSNLTDYIDFDASTQSYKIRDINDLPDALKAGIESIKMTDKGIELKLRNAVEALKELAKIYKLYDVIRDDADIKGHVFFIGGFHEHHQES